MKKEHHKYHQLTVFPFIWDFTRTLDFLIFGVTIENGSNVLIMLNIKDMHFICKLRNNLNEFSFKAT